MRKNIVGLSIKRLRLAHGLTQEQLAVQMQLRGLSGGHVRCPLHDATQDERDLVAQLFAQYGISRHLETR